MEEISSNQPKKEPVSCLSKCWSTDWRPVRAAVCKGVRPFLTRPTNYLVHVPNKITSSVADPWHLDTDKWHLDTDPDADSDPRTRISDYRIRMRIREAEKHTDPEH